MEHKDIIIVGSGHAGVQAANVLRQTGYDGSIAIVSQDSDPPYERPPLSKEFLAGSKPFEKILFRPDAFWVDRRIEVRLRSTVDRINPESKTVSFTACSALNYGTLIWAAGGEPRRLTCQGGELPQVHAIRARSDITAVMAQLPSTRHVTLIGGGYIGLEVAAVLVALGKDVTLVEREARLLSRVAGEEIATFLENAHRGHGVDIRLGDAVDCIEGEDNHVVAVRLSSGERIETQMVIAGIGIEPSVSALAAAGAEVSNGVLVNPYCQTSIPDIYAIGDCAAHVNRFAQGQIIRLESVQNANDQAATAAKAICGQLVPYDAVPRFWSNQYDFRLQTVGISRDHDQTVLRGDKTSGSFSIVYLRDRKIIAIDSINAPRDFAHGRKIVEEGMILPIEGLIDQNIALNDLIPVGMS